MIHCLKITQSKHLQKISFSNLSIIEKKLNRSNTINMTNLIYTKVEVLWICIVLLWGKFINKELK